ncbi:MAG: biopolymer transporter ExbD [Treponema sp.]|jgi:biopolymer transport protein ExbD|nr:biopolymer transporter ExbD [Treponema sp.]
MKLRKKRGNPFGDSSASSDIAFLLIIYFIVIAGFNVNKGFLMNLPAKDSTRLIQKDDLLRFELDGNGQIIYKNEIRDFGFAEQEIGAAAAHNPNMAVMLSIDPAASWQNVVSFVEIAQKCKIDSFSFSMKKSGEGR